MRSFNVKGILLPKGNRIGPKLISAGVIISQLLACGEFKKETITNNIPAPAKETDVKENALIDAKFLLQATDIPHQYQMVITWPEEIKKVFIEESGKRVFSTESGNQHILTLKDNTRYNLRVFSNDESKPTLIGESIGETPIDFTFSGLVEIKEDTEINSHRVFFVNKPKILTNGKNLIIKTDSLLSDEAEITSFPQGIKAPLETSGLGGGLVHINAKTAIGHVRIYLRGQHGGDGISGLPWESRAADGPGGRSGAHDCLRSYIGGPLKCWCTRQPSNGADGVPGAKGRNGTQPGQGGNSGKILVEITDPSEFVVEPFQEIGLAGNSGKGGPGQEGGEGGPAGDRSSNECSRARGGYKGPTGPQGDDAPIAINGSTETLCISIGQGEGKCNLK